MSARHRRLRVVVGDASDAGKVSDAVAGNEAVISVLGSRQPSNRSTLAGRGTRMDRFRPVPPTSSRR